MQGPPSPLFKPEFPGPDTSAQWAMCRSAAHNTAIQDGGPGRVTTLCTWDHQELRAGIAARENSTSLSAAEIPIKHTPLLAWPLGKAGSKCSIFILYFWAMPRHIPCNGSTESLLLDHQGRIKFTFASKPSSVSLYWPE